MLLFKWHSREASSLLAEMGTSGTKISSLEFSVTQACLGREVGPGNYTTHGAGFPSCKLTRGR